LENVRLPWYQQKVVEDKGTVVIDASSSVLLNRNVSVNQPIIKDLNDINPLKVTILNTSEKYEIENHERDIKIDSYKAEQLARNYIQEKNRGNISYTDRNEGQKYQPYLPWQGAITILSKELDLLPIWHFEYTFRDKKFEETLLASSGKILESNFHTHGVICEDCGESMPKSAAIPCSICDRWVCPSETVRCSSCERIFHKVHFDRICSICHEMVCNECLTTCPICKKEYGNDHLVNCHDCGLALCSNCSVTSGLIFKKARCPTCEAHQQQR
jgi:hypothetical protein